MMVTMTMVLGNPWNNGDDADYNDVDDDNVVDDDIE